MYGGGGKRALARAGVRAVLILLGAVFIIPLPGARGQGDPACITIGDPVTLLNPFPNGGDRFGSSVSRSGGLGLVGAELDDEGGIANAGAAYIMDAGTGARLHTLLRPGAGVGDRFGASVFLDGTFALVGAPSSDLTGAANAGTADLFDASDGSHLLTLTHPSPGASDEFGTAVATSGGMALVGAPRDDPGANEAGAAFLFDTTDGTLLRTFLNPAPDIVDRFGSSVALGDGYALIGAPQDKPSGVINAGSAYLFSVTTGALLHTFSNPGAVRDDFFGSSVALGSGVALIGEPDDDTVAMNAGAAHFFDTATGVLIQSVFNPLPPTRQPESDRFGASVSISGAYSVIGAPGQTLPPNRQSAFLYSTSSAGLIGAIGRPAGEGQEFGHSLSIESGSIVISALNAGGPSYTGEAYALNGLIEGCCPGDADCSGGFVDALDFISVQDNFGADGPVGHPGDADCSGSFVDAADFIAVQANFGSDCGGGIEKSGNGVSVLASGPGVPLIRFESPAVVAQLGGTIVQTVRLDTNSAEVSMANVFVDFDGDRLQFSGGAVVAAVWDHAGFNVDPMTHPGHDHVCLNAARSAPFTVNGQDIPVATLSFEVVGEGLSVIRHADSLLSETMSFVFGPGFSMLGHVALEEIAVVGIDGVISAADLAGVVAEIQDEAFDKNPAQRRNALLNKIDAISQQIANGITNGAVNKLENDIRAKADGCFGGQPNNDWITDCTAQAAILAVVDALIAELEP